MTAITVEDLFDNQPQPKKYSLWISGLIAVLVHGFLLLQFYDVKFFELFNRPETQTTYQITLLPNKPDTLRPSSEQDVK